MRIKSIISLLIVLAMLMPAKAFADVNDKNSGQIEWLPEDFTYEDQDLASKYTMMPATNTSDVLTGTIHVISGLTESGEAKLNDNKDIVIPAKDPDGIKVQGLGSYSLKDKGITSIQLPVNVTTDNDGKWDSSVETRGDFFLGTSSLSGNELTELTLPEGVIYVGGNALKNNKLREVTFPSTIMMIANQAFASNEIQDLCFPENTIFPLQLDSMSFAVNKLTEVYLPSKTEKVSKYAFFQNTGMEPVEYGTDQEKKGGVVYFHITDPGRFIEDTVTGKSNVQMMIAEYSGSSGDEEEEESTSDSNAWTTLDFTYDEYEKRLYGCDYSRDFTIKGIAITGFSENGEQKLESNKDLVIPSKDDKGNTIIGVAPGAFKGKGLSSVKFPSGMLVNYNDTVTYRITKRGNFIIGENAFANNNLTSINLPDGVIAVLGSAFTDNKLTTVSLPKTIWWVETMAFARNQISKVNFPETTYFQFEMHGWPFAENQIKSVRLPDYTVVVNKYSFMRNPGMQKLSDAELRQAYPTPVIAPTVDEQIALIKSKNQDGIVYMYADTIDMADMDRIHHYDKTTSSTHSWFQKLIINDGTPATQNPEGDNWNIKDFTVKGTTITGLSASGIEKRKTNKNLVIPDYNAQADSITEIASAPSNSTGGLFATADEKFDSVTLPSGLLKIGDNAFRESGISEVAFPPALEEIGESAFQMNKLTAVVLPDTVTKLGRGAFASNKSIEKIILSSGLTVIPEGAFGCSDGKNWMKGLTEIEIPYGITKIESRAFAGNNFHEIVIPEGVTEIGSYAFSTKNYLLLDDNTECRVVLPSTLKTIGDRAFRNKKIASIDIPKDVQSIKKNTFEKVLSTYGTPDIPGSMVYSLTTQVNLRNKAQFEDKTNFPDTKHHKMNFVGFEAWESSDFTYGDTVYKGESIRVVTGLSESGVTRIETNKEIALPAEDEAGTAVVGVASNAFTEKQISELQVPETYKHIGDKSFSANGINTLTIPDGIEYIGDEAFSENSISYVTFPETIAHIGASAFANNNISGLKFTDETRSPLEIYSKAFAYNSIKSVQLPDGTKKVASDAFLSNKGRKGIVYMYVINPGTEVEENPSSQKLIADEQMPAEDTWQIDDFEYSVDGDAILGFSEEGRERLKITHDVVLPDAGPGGESITQIVKDAFAVDESDVDVGKYDYASSGGISSVVLPKHLEKIGDRAFEYNSLKSIDFGRCSNLSEIGMSAFHGNKLLEVQIPDSVSKLGEGAFSANNIYKLKLSSGVTVIPQGAFSMNIRLAQITIPDTVTEIGEMAFAGARLTSLNIPASVIKIGRKAFHLHHIANLTIPGTVKEIGESAFEGTYKAQTLKNLTLGEGIEHIGKYAFKEGLLTKVTLPKSLKTMGLEPFINNTGTGQGHVVTLISYNPAHLAFNDGARFHKVIDQAAADAKAAEEARKAAAAKKAADELKEWVGTPSGKIPAVKSAKFKAAKKKVTVSWKKATKKNLKKFDKVEVQVCPNKKFQKAETKRLEVKKTKKSATVKKLKKGTYFVRVRNVKGSGTGKLVSKWSKVKKVKVK